MHLILDTRSTVDLHCNLACRMASRCSAASRRAGALDVDAAKAAGVLPGRAFGELKAGRAVQSVGGEMVQPEQVRRLHGELQGERIGWLWLPRSHCLICTPCQAMGSASVQMRHSAVRCRPGGAGRSADAPRSCAGDRSGQARPAAYADQRPIPSAAAPCGAKRLCRHRARGAGLHKPFSPATCIDCAPAHGADITRRRALCMGFQVPPDSSMSRGQLHGTSADMDGELLTPAAAVASVAERLGAALTRGLA